MLSHGALGIGLLAGDGIGLATQEIMSMCLRTSAVEILICRWKQHVWYKMAVVSSVEAERQRNGERIHRLLGLQALEELLLHVYELTPAQA